MNRSAELELQTPVVVVGMHRSGTTMVARALQRLGVFIGSPVDSLAESRFFVRLNVQVFSAAHASWDRPEPVRELLAEADLVPDLCTVLRDPLSGPSSRGYLGWQRLAAARGRGIAGLQEPWGWKDPRSTYTLPLWLKLFPNARVVHVFRNGVDVAASLWRREHRRQRVVGSKVASVRCRSLERAFDLWVEYENRAREVTAGLPTDRLLELRYEDVLAEPGRELSKLDRLGVPVEEGELRATIDAVRPERAYGFRSDPDLRQLYEQRRAQPLMVARGYDDIG